MNKGRLQFLKPQPVTVAVFTLLGTIVWLGSIKGLAIFGEVPPPQGIEPILAAAPWWEMSLVAGLPGHIILSLLGGAGVGLQSWMSVIVYGVTSYLIACFCEYVWKSIRIAQEKARMIKSGTPNSP